MKKDTSPSGLDTELLHNLIKRNEPSLTPGEKQTMWNEIDQRTSHRRILQRRPLWYAAATVLLFIIAGSAWLYTPFASNPYTRLSAMVNVDTLKNIRLYIEDQEIELDEQAEIHCLPATHQIEIRMLNNVSFRLSAPQQDETFLQVAVPTGKRAQIYLADQSKITLREQSKLIFPLQFAAHSRKVRLEGEAYMQIAHDKARKFSTQTQAMEVSVLGTEFLVSAYANNEEQSVVLISGCVEVQPVSGEKVKMAPNQKYAYNTATHRHTLDKDVNTAPIISWIEDLLVMKDEPLNNVLKQIEYLYRVNFNYDWNALDRIRINGKLDVSVPLDEVLKNLGRIAPIQIKKEQKVITIIKQP